MARLIQASANCSNQVMKEQGIVEKGPEGERYNVPLPF